ncbi:zinc-finger domain-containing protein [Anoxybacillus ayderensis]|uniref:zinc-finger domain-containing protein n=1 Tax=unclassified Anoxybacillus TaxID=2639704 RepID=UPI00031A3A09|nr:MULTISPECIES: zinc-finger domain-containing protein [unclassified Anoxybacillus]AXM90421.1 zinc-finger domain-containing protein [Anoxybacillus ayderensis G10]MBW9218358.1 zinc-finger domain-containing protein [Anoxybacillus sp. ST70]NNU96825.1 zinc-finger domain-containing protein [Anoxybacillus sp. EFIL]THD15669.1 zinc-finger domain-containing protein [Anoxybacillus ayderensis]
MNRKDVLLRLNELFDTYCEGCFVNRTFRKECGKSYAQSFCIQTCTVGKKIQQYGQLLVKQKV